MNFIYYVIKYDCLAKFAIFRKNITILSDIYEV